jgi:LETM1-like protein
MLPSTFEDKLKKEEELKKRLTAKLEVARFLQVPPVCCGQQGFHERQSSFGVAFLLNVINLVTVVSSRLPALPSGMLAIAFASQATLPIIASPHGGCTHESCALHCRAGHSGRHGDGHAGQPHRQRRRLRGGAVPVHAEGAVLGAD